MDSESPLPPFLCLPSELTALILTNLSIDDLKNLEQCSNATQSLVEGTLYASIRTPPRGGRETRFAWVMFNFRPTLIEHLRKLELGHFDPIGIRMLFAIEFPNLMTFAMRTVQEGLLGEMADEEKTASMNGELKAQPMLRDFTFSVAFSEPSAQFLPVLASDAPLFQHPKLQHLSLRGLDLNGFDNLPSDYFSLPNLQTLTVNACWHTSIDPVHHLTRSAKNLTHIEIDCYNCYLPFSHLQLPTLLNPHKAHLKALDIRFAADKLPAADTVADPTSLATLSTFPSLRYLRIPLPVLFGTNAFSPTRTLQSIAAQVLPPNLKVLVAEHIVCAGSVPEEEGTVFRISERGQEIMRTILENKFTLTPSLSRFWLLYAPHFSEPAWLNELAARKGVHMTQLYAQEAKMPSLEWLDRPAEKLVFGEGERSTEKERGLIGCGNLPGECMRRWCRDAEPREGLVGWLCS